MKRKTLVKSFTIVAAISIVILLLFSSLIQPPIPFRAILRHVDPSSENKQFPFSLFLVFQISELLKSLINGNFRDASEKLKNLKNISIPEEYRFIFNRFNELLEEISNQLNATKYLLDQAEELIINGKSEDARSLLNEASLKLASANITYIELRVAFNEFAKTFGLPIDRLQKLIDRLGEVINEYYDRLLRLFKMIQDQRLLEDTFLSINVTPKTIWTGGNLEISGTLYTNNTFLANKTLEILLDESPLTKVLTNERGEFKIKVKIPYIYKPSIILKARYIPTGFDSEIYKPTVSNNVTVKLLYIQPIIKVETIGKALPGKTFVLNGYVETNRSLPYTSLLISWTGTSLNATLNEGKFSIELYTPANIPDGEYELRIKAPPFEIFAPAEITLLVRVERIPLNFEIQQPGVIIAGLASQIQIKLVDEENVNFTARLSFMDQIYTVNASTQASFNLVAPLTVLSGYHHYKITIFPSLPWYKSSEFEGSILVINPLTILVPIIISSVMTFELLKRKRKKIIEEPYQEQKVSEQAITRVYSETSKFKELIDLYWQAVAIVSEITSIEMKPSMTLREYLEFTGPKLKELKKAFEIITIATEKAIYAPLVLNEEIEATMKAFEELKVMYVKVQL